MPKAPNDKWGECCGDVAFYTAREIQVPDELSDINHVK